MSHNSGNTQERPVLGISSRPTSPMDPYNSSKNQYETKSKEAFDPIVPFDEEIDTLASNRSQSDSLRPLASDREKPTAPTTTYLTPTFTRKTTAAAVHEAKKSIKIITPDQEHPSFDNIDNKSSFSIVDSGSNSNASTQKNRDLQLENVRYREEIASLRASLNEKDVMIEHLTKIVEGFQSKVPEDVTDSHTTNAKAHAKAHGGF